MKKSNDIRSFFRSASNIKTYETTPLQVDNIEERKSLSVTPNVSEVLNPPNDEAGQSSGSVLTVQDLGTLESGPSRPVINFPKTSGGDKQRCFSVKFYETNNWLEYSVKEDKVYCFVCRLFTVKYNREDAFSQSGFSKWRKLTECLKKHEESLLHKQSTEKYIMYKNSLGSGNVYDQLLVQHQGEVTQNKEYLLKLIDVMLCLARQGLPMRGHREDVESRNRGNLLEICEMFSRYDDSFSKNFNKNVSYCSPQIQNEIIDTAAKLTLNEIVIEIKNCGFFALMVDEARSFKEQELSIVLRYVKDLEVEERFVGFINCSESRDASSLCHIILQFFEHCGLKNVPIVAQSYDGANVMSGRKGGLQVKIKESNPQAVYFHCLAHKLNLVIVNSCSNLPFAAVFFNTLECLHTHFSQPGNHAQLIKVRDLLGIKSGAREMGSLSSTRWSCRFENCNAVMNNYAAIKEVLEEEVAHPQGKSSVEALGILTCITKPDFIVQLFVFHYVLSITNVLSKFFQAKDSTLGRASDAIAGVLSEFSAKKEAFGGLWKNISEFAAVNEVCLKPIQNQRKRKLPQKLDNFVVESVPNMESDDISLGVSDEEYWAKSVLQKLMDTIIQNFENRFGNLPLARSVDAFLKLDLNGAMEFIHNYQDISGVNLNDLNAEVVVMRNMLGNKQLDINLSTLKQEIKADITPNIYKLLQIACCLPISSAGCERSFSAMRRIKTWLRSSMTQDRFSNLALLNIESTLVKEKVTSERVLNLFAEKKRKLKLV